MRILAISDIHGNLEALRRVLDAAGPVDHVLCTGDLVDYGPRPRECVTLVRERAAVTVRGNHDEAAAFDVSCRCGAAYRAASEATREQVRRALPADQLAWLGQLPIQADLTLGGVRFHLVHATPEHPLYEYLRPDQAARWAAQVEAIDADVILVGHTHLPMILRVGAKVVVNPGSVGQPRDGDPRAGFALIDDGVPSLQRCAYDVEATVSDLAATGLSAEWVEQLAGNLRRGRM